jgi:hypothetical protein
LVTLQDGTVDPSWRRSFFICHHSGMVMVLFTDDGIFLQVWHLGSFKCSLFPIQWGVLLAVFLFLVNFCILVTEKNPVQ